MKLVWMYVCICAIILALKFVRRVFKRLGDSMTMDDAIDRIENGMDNAADKVAGYFKGRKRKRKEEEKPIVTIR